MSEGLVKQAAGEQAATPWTAKKTGVSVGDIFQRRSDRRKSAPAHAIIGGAAGRGIQAGKQVGEERYGVTSPELGAGVRDIFQRRLARMDKKSAAQSEMRENINRQADMARARGASAAQIHAINRAGTRDLGRDLDATERRNLGDAQSLLGRIIQGQTATEGAYGSLAAGQGVPASAPRLDTGIGMLGTVICTELHRQGRISDRTLDFEKAFGKKMRDNHPWVYYGYLFIGMKIVRIMRKNSRFSDFIHKGFWRWFAYQARNDYAHVTGHRSRLYAPFGGLINLFGLIVCPLFYFPWGMRLRAKTEAIERIGTMVFSPSWQ